MISSSCGRLSAHSSPPRNSDSQISSAVPVADARIHAVARGVAQADRQRAVAGQGVVVVVAAHLGGGLHVPGDFDMRRVGHGVGQQGELQAPRLFQLLGLPGVVGQRADEPAGDEDRHGAGEEQGAVEERQAAVQLLREQRPGPGQQVPGDADREDSRAVDPLADSPYLHGRQPGQGHRREEDGQGQLPGQVRTYHRRVADAKSPAFASGCMVPGGSVETVEKERSEGRPGPLPPGVHTLRRQKPSRSSPAPEPASYTRNRWHRRAPGRTGGSPCGRRPGPSPRRP